LNIIGQKGKYVIVRLQRSKYDPHQNTRERKRRLKQMINGQLPAVAHEADLIAEYLKCR
jgi:hypothetical protein